MADAPKLTRPRLNTTIAQSSMDALEGLTVGLNLPHVGVTIDYIVAERDRLLAALGSGYQYPIVTPQEQPA